MSSLEHSPMPWEVVGDHVKDDNGGHVADIYASGASDARIEANAAFIVKAVNAHAKLTEALEPIKEGIDRSPWHWVEGEKMSRILIAESAINRINEALALAKGGQ